jgi:hypothetical protein
MLKILGVRPHEPRPQQYSTDGTMVVPMTIYLFNDEILSFDRGDDEATITFTKYKGQETYCGFKFEIRTDNSRVLKTYSKFFENWSNWVVTAKGDDSINSFLSFLQTNKIPLIHYWDGMFYQSPDQKCFRWYYDNRNQGRLFADSQISALKRIQKRGQYNSYSMSNIRVEEVEFQPIQHTDVPNWIINNTPEH